MFVAIRTKYHLFHWSVKVLVWVVPLALLVLVALATIAMVTPWMFPRPPIAEVLIGCSLAVIVAGILLIRDEIDDLR